MPGIPCIYNGDEIGMRQIDGLPSKEGGYGRTGARTPMQWTGGNTAGFSSAASDELYVPIDPSADRPNVEAQESDANSLQNFVRELCRLRSNSPALGPLGDFDVLYAESKKYPLIYLRSKGEERYLIVVNPSGSEVSAVFRSSVLRGHFEVKIGEGVRIAKGEGDQICVHAQGISFAVIAV